jgi:hypothetical protein
MDTIFPKGQIQAVVSVASDDFCRQGIYGVSVGDGYLCATDGHRLLQVKATASAAPSAYVAKEGLQIAAAAAKGKGAAVRLNGRIEARNGAGAVLATAELVPIDAQFPPVDQAIPQDGPAIASFNPRLLGETLLAMARAGCECVSLTFAESEAHVSPLKIAGIAADGGAEVVAVVMPRRA